MDQDTAIGGPHGRFPSTQVSLLEAASAGLPGEALDRVMALYWKPVYKYIRFRFGKDNEDAKDLTQSFFAAALQREFFARFDPAKASFRTYLRMAVERFAASQHAAANRQKRGGNVEFEPVEEQAATAESPEQVFEREWQRQLFSLALDDLRAHCETSGKQLQFPDLRSLRSRRGRAAFLRRPGRASWHRGNRRDQPSCLGAPHAARIRHRTVARRYVRRAGTA